MKAVFLSPPQKILCLIINPPEKFCQGFSAQKSGKKGADNHLVSSKRQTEKKRLRKPKICRMAGVFRLGGYTPKGGFDKNCWRFSAPVKRRFLPPLFAYNVAHNASKIALRITGLFTRRR